jgi:membrane-associated phospholipid phosphatase
MTARSTAHAAPMVEATDALILFFLGALAMVGGTRSAAWLVSGIALLGAAIVLAAAWSRRQGWRGVVHDFLPVVAVIAIFELLGPVIDAVNPVRWDATFAALDERLFGRLPAAWFEALGRPAWLVDVASTAYVSYYLLPVVLAVALYVRRHDRFRRFAFTVVATFLASYVGYLAFPTSGPRIADDVLGGGAVTRALRGFVASVEGNQLDAFPSGHVAVTLVCVGCGWRYFPRWRIPLAAVFVGIAFATVYLAYHYVIDVVAGVALGGAVLIALPEVARRFIAGDHRPSSHACHRPPAQAIRSKRAAR